MEVIELVPRGVVIVLVEAVGGISVVGDGVSSDDC